ncbi:hypothetical protein ACO1LR_13435, partial [Staphylococcus aureus]
MPGDLLHVDRVRVQDPVRAADDLLDRRLSDAVVVVGGDLAEVDAWAVHPGGRSILDRVEAALDLDATALAPSREVLRAHG